MTFDLLRAIKTAIFEHSKAGLLSIWMGGQPVAASRPRVGKWGTYYGKKYGAWRKETWKYVDSLDQVPTDRPVAVIVEAIFTKAKTSRLEQPSPDVDNLAKGPLDLLTKATKETGNGPWQDDRHITCLVSLKRFAEEGEEPGFLISYAELELT